MEAQTMKNKKQKSPVVETTRMGDITFHRNGRIDITAHVAQSLTLKPGDVVNIMEKDTCCKEYYIYVARRKEQAMGRHACTCHRVKDKGNYLRVFSKMLATFMLSICHAEDKVALRVGKMEKLEGIGPAMPIITLTQMHTI